MIISPYEQSVRGNLSQQNMAIACCCLGGALGTSKALISWCTLVSDRNRNREGTETMHQGVGCLSFDFNRGGQCVFWRNNCGKTMCPATLYYILCNMHGYPRTTLKTSQFYSRTLFPTGQRPSQLIARQSKPIE